MNTETPCVNCRYLHECIHAPNKKEEEVANCLPFWAFLKDGKKDHE